MEELFTGLLKNNKEQIFRMCTAYSACHDDAKDLFQEVIINIWRSLPSFRHRSAINTWVYRITINVCMRWKQKEDTRKKPLIQHVRLEHISIAAPAVGNYTDLYACINKLNDTDKSVALLYLEDLSYKEIAAITGLSENNIAVKIMRIKAKLFTCLKP